MDCFKAQEAARCRASSIFGFTACDFSPLEISSKAHNIWSSSASSERSAEDSKDSSVSFGAPSVRSIERTRALGLRLGGMSASPRLWYSAESWELRGDIVTSRFIGLEIYP